MKGLARLGCFRSRLGDDEWFAGLGAGSGTWGAAGGVGVAGGGVPWLLTHRLVLLFAASRRVVDSCLDGRCRGLRPGWGRAVVRDEAFDSNDHRKSLDLAGP